MLTLNWPLEMQKLDIWLQIWQNIRLPAYQQVQTVSKKQYCRSLLLLTWYKNVQFNYEAKVYIPKKNLTRPIFWTIPPNHKQATVTPYVSGRSTTL